MMTEPKLLSDCGTCLVLDDKDKYQINIQEGDYLLIEVGNKTNTPSAKFNHPNIAATEKRIYEFKHYRSSGSKFWTRSAGLSFYFIIPKTAIKLLPEKGYSYIKAEINGVKVSFNVSGGGGSENNGWTDYLSNFTQISVGHKLAELKKLAEVAVRNPELEAKIKRHELDENELKRWNELATNSNSELKETIAKMIEAGKNPIIRLNEGLSYCGEKQGIGIKVSRRCRKTNIEKLQNGTIRYNLEWIGSIRGIIISTSKYDNCEAKLTQINWLETAKLNQLA